MLELMRRRKVPQAQVPDCERIQSCSSDLRLCAARTEGSRSHATGAVHMHVADGVQSQYLADSHTGLAIILTVRSNGATPTQTLSKL